MYGGTFTVYREGVLVGEAHNLMTSDGIDLIENVLTGTGNYHTGRVMGGMRIGSIGGTSQRSGGFTQSTNAQERQAIVRNANTVTADGAMTISFQADFPAVASPVVTEIKNIAIVYGGGSTVTSGEITFAAVSEDDPGITWLPVNRTPNTAFTITYTLIIG